MSDATCPVLHHDHAARGSAANQRWWPEQLNLAVIDHSRGDDPWCLLTADFLLVGDVARPDLAQGGPGWLPPALQPGSPSSR